MFSGASAVISPFRLRQTNIRGFSKNLFVIPAQSANIQVVFSLAGDILKWIPAKAGMTTA